MAENELRQASPDVSAEADGKSTRGGGPASAPDDRPAPALTVDRSSVEETTSGGVTEVTDTSDNVHGPPKTDADASSSHHLDNGKDVIQTDSTASAEPAVVEHEDNCEHQQSMESAVQDRRSTEETSKKPAVTEQHAEPMAWLKDSTCKKLVKLTSKLKSGQFRRVLVVTGAGVSTNAGVPDFRSDDGLYARLAEIGLPDPTAVFDLEYFRNDPEVFYSLAHELHSDDRKPTDTHRFMRLLSDRGILHRLYTQNIDCLDTAAGVPQERLIEAHGSFRTGSCIECRKDATQQTKEALRVGTVPHCTQCGGVVKPDIVFFGEDLPKRFYSSLRPDICSADLCIVMGTSLQVYPVASVPELLPRHVPRVLVNREPAGSIGERGNDIVLLGDVDEVVRGVAEMCGWLADLDTLEIPLQPDV